MRQTLSKGAFAAAAATGILSLYGSPALADADASGVAKDSPGVLSGNSVQAPVHVPVNLCGNTVNGLAALNKAIGNSCKNTSHKSKHHDAGADASAVVKGSPGVGSGNNVQLPVDVPVNVCGNSVDGGALLNTAYGNDCENESSGGGGYGHGHDHGHDTPSTDEEKTPPVKEVPSKPDHKTPDSTTPDTETSSTSREEAVEEGPLPQLAETGSEALAAASAASAALIVGGVMMYRRGRTTSSR
ncbi:chaplin [Streptomyces violarus]|uniref:chaplin n=1 Tax=Streptomyces violarus TaxID=67380 RepID=UPI0028F6EBD2|nr:chaplin [Streptomyces violarus]